MLKLRLLLAFLMVSAMAFGQPPTSAPNETDAEGKKTGMWIVWAREKKNLKGYTADAVYEYGEFVGNRRQGIWQRFFASGRLLSEINYESGRKRGAFKVYRDSDEHALYEEGAMSSNGLKQVGKHTITNEKGIVTLEKNYNEKGEMEGPQIYRYPHGQVEVEFTKKNGKNVGTTTYYYPNGDVKKTIKYSDTGEVLETKEMPRVNPEYVPPTPPKPKKQAPVKSLPKGAHIQVDGKKIPVSQIPDGYNKVFLVSGDILYDGWFKGGKLKKGEFFVYDEDGLILRIEVYEDFEYQGKGVITD